MGIEQSEISIRPEQEQTPPESLRILAAAGNISDLFAQAALEAYSPNKPRISAPQHERTTTALSTNRRVEPGRIGRIMQRVRGALVKQPTKSRVEALAEEIDVLREAIPLPLTYEVDDSTPSTETRGRVYTRVALPKKELDELLKKDGLTLKVDAISHKIRIVAADGRVMDARMPYLLEGSRFYVDEEGQRYLFEQLSLLDPELITRYGQMSQTDSNAAAQLTRITNPPRKELEPGTKE